LVNRTDSKSGINQVCGLTEKSEHQRPSCLIITAAKLPTKEELQEQFKYTESRYGGITDFEKKINKWINS